jgi:hypothetical protein
MTLTAKTTGLLCKLTGIIALVLAATVFLGNPAVVQAASGDAPSAYSGTVGNDGSLSPTDREFSCSFKSSAHVRCEKSGLTDNKGKSYWYDPGLSKTAGHDVFRPDDGATLEEYGRLHFPESMSGDYSMGYVCKSDLACDPEKAARDNDVGDGSFTTDPDDDVCTTKDLRASRPDRDSVAVSCTVGGGIGISRSVLDYASGWDVFQPGGFACPDDGMLSFITCPILKMVFKATNGLLVALIGVLDMSSGEFAKVEDLVVATRNLANILFAIVFLVIIFANGLSINLDAYTLKKLVPRLVAAVIMVQFSFLICMVGIELSYAIGYGIDATLSAAAQSAGLPVVGGPTEAVAIAVSGAKGFGSVLGVLITMIYMVLMLVAVAIGFVISVLRYFMVWILVLLAPLAFVAKILPQTEKLFKTWSTNFLKALLMFPMIIGLLGVANVMTVAVADTGGAPAKFVAPFIPIIALFLVPKTFKWSGSMLGAASTKVSGAVSGQAKKQTVGRAKDAYTKDGGLRDKKTAAMPTFGMKGRIQSQGRALAAIDSSKEGWTKGLDEEQLGKVARGRGKTAKVAQAALDKKFKEEREKQEDRAATGKRVDYGKLNKLAANAGYIDMPTTRNADGKLDYGSTPLPAPAGNKYGDALNDINNAATAHQRRGAGGGTPTPGGGTPTPGGGTPTPGGGGPMPGAPRRPTPPPAGPPPTPPPAGPPPTPPPAGPPPTP